MDVSSCLANGLEPKASNLREMAAFSMAGNLLVEWIGSIRLYRFMAGRVEWSHSDLSDSGVHDNRKPIIAFS